jgi:hypothetical protein
VENKLIEFLTMQVEALRQQNEKLQQILKEQTDYICENNL